MTTQSDEQRALAFLTRIGAWQDTERGPASSDVDALAEVFAEIRSEQPQDPWARLGAWLADRDHLGMRHCVKVNDAPVGYRRVQLTSLGEGQQRWGGEGNTLEGAITEALDKAESALASGREKP